MVQDPDVAIHPEVMIGPGVDRLGRDPRLIALAQPEDLTHGIDRFQAGCQSSVFLILLVVVELSEMTREAETWPGRWRSAPGLACWARSNPPHRSPERFSQRQGGDGVMFGALWSSRGAGFDPWSERRNEGQPGQRARVHPQLPQGLPGDGNCGPFCGRRRIIRGM